MKTRAFLSYLLVLFLALVPAAGPAAPGGAHGAPAPAGAGPDQSYTWQIDRVEAPRAFEYLGSRSLALDAAGHPHLAYGADFLYHAWHDGSGWRFEVADGSGSVGRYTSLALDALGRPHIAYRSTWPRYEVKYAHYDGSAWQVEVVETGSFGPTALALDALGRPHIAYAVENALRYAAHDGTAWHVQTVEGVDCGEMSLALDAAGFAHIAYHAYTGYALKYAREETAGWHVETLDSTDQYYGFTPSLAVDAAGRPRIAYYDGEEGKLQYARFDGSAWHIQPVPTSGGGGPSLVLDAGGHPCIAFTGGVSMRYARHDGVAWHVEPFDGYGAEASLALDAAGRPHVSHRRGPFLKYSYDDGAAWQTETVDTAAHTEMYSAIALDGQGGPHVSYLVHFTGSPPPQYWDLRVARREGPAWPDETAATGREGAENSLALDAAGRPHLAWASCDYTWNECDLRHARYDGTAWQVTTVESAGDVGEGNSLALDAAGHDHISYVDGTNHALKYARYDGAAWQVAVVDTGVRGRTSLALDAAGRPHISYHTDAGLRYACDDGTGWQRQTVELGEDVGIYSSLALDSRGRPHIAYSNGQYWPVLTYAWYDGAAWHGESVTGAAVGGFALALDAADRPRIAYHSWTADNLDYAWHNGAGWYTATVDSANQVGWYPALALDAAGRPHIAYSDWTNGDIKYAHGVPQCVPVTGAEIAGPALLPLGLPGLYEAAAAPVSATLPFTYTWDNGAVGSPAAYSWPSTGTHALAVTASNGCGQAQGAFTVTVFCQPVGGVAIAGPGTLLVGQVGVYEAAVQPITASLPVTLTWDNGTAGPTAPYSWTAVGTYTVAVTAANPCGQGPAAGQPVRIISTWPYAIYLGLVVRGQ